MRKPVVIFGAGATAACGGPMTNRILPAAFETLHAPNPPQTFQREGLFRTVEDFLVDQFHLPPRPTQRNNISYPALPLLLSLLDTAIDRNQPFGGRNPGQLRQVRYSIEYLIFAVLEESLKATLSNNPYAQLLEKLDAVSSAGAQVISLNYDIIADNVMFDLALKQRIGTTGERVPSYGCDIRTEAYRKRKRKHGLLLKLHGSLNWLYCPNCHRLDVGLSKRSSNLQTRKVLDDLYQAVDLEERYSCQGAPCPECKSEVRPVLITPTHKKDYRNPHIGQVWYHAERVLRNADRVFIVGYSLPEDDVEVIYLLKRGVAHLVANDGAITVVQQSSAKAAEGDAVGKRYRTLLGPKFEWSNEGFSGWLSTWDGS